MVFTAIHYHNDMCMGIWNVHNIKSLQKTHKRTRALLVRYFFLNFFIIFFSVFYARHTVCTNTWMHICVCVLALYIAYIEWVEDCFIDLHNDDVYAFNTNRNTYIQLPLFAACTQFSQNEYVRNEWKKKWGKTKRKT